MKLQRFIPIAGDGVPFIAVSALLTLLSLIVTGPGIISIFFVLITIFIVYFFRDPERAISAGANSILSPADGKIVFMGEVLETRILKRRVKKLSIFMSPLNVHVNRMPVNGIVRKIIYNSGNFFNASSEKSSLDNEQNAILVERIDGHQILFVQIAGFIARRIVCRLLEGKSYIAGKRIGMIRFGSRVDIYLPPEAKFLVTLNEKVTGGSTVIALLDEIKTAKQTDLRKET